MSIVKNYTDTEYVMAVGYAMELGIAQDVFICANQNHFLDLVMRGSVARQGNKYVKVSTGKPVLVYDRNTGKGRIV